MKNKQLKLIAALLLIVFSSWNFAGATTNKTKGKSIYRVALKSDAAKAVVVKKNVSELELNLEGFGQPIILKVTGGGVKTCRTVLEHKSDKATIIVSLPIAVPNTPCQMTEGFVSINSAEYKISLAEETVGKTVGSDAQLRNLVEKYFGKN